MGTRGQAIANLSRNKYSTSETAERQRQRIPPPSHAWNADKLNPTADHTYDLTTNDSTLMEVELDHPLFAGKHVVAVFQPP